MKIKGILGLALFAGVSQLPGMAGAQTRGGFEVGAEIVDYSYRERLDGETIVRDDGHLAGLTLGYTETLSKGWFVHARLSGSTGKIDYRSDDTEGEVRLDNVKQGIGQVELQLGHDFLLGGGASVTPFIGLGSRTLTDESGGEVSTNGFFGYDRRVSYNYVPLGLTLRQPVGQGDALVISAQYNWVVGGDVKTELSDVDPSLPDFTVGLNDGNGFELSALAELGVGRRAWKFGPFVRRWSLDRSDGYIVTDPDFPGEALEFYEPENSTTEWGFKLSFAF